MLLPLLLLLLPLVAAPAHAQKKGNASNQGYDHRAHSVPGGPYTGVDVGRNKDAVVFLDGGRSHSHFYNPNTRVTGKIIKYEWLVNFKPFCRSVKCKHRFPRGVSIVRLNVMDNTGDKASATVRVNVVSGAKPGLRFWFYPDNGMVREPRLAGTPSVSRNVPLAKLRGKGSYPGVVRDRKFSMRVLGDITFPVSGMYRFRLQCEGGNCNMWLNNKKVIKGGFRTIPSKIMPIAKGPMKLHILYRRNFTGPKVPKMALFWRRPGAKEFTVVPKFTFSHKPSILPPVINSILPKKGRIGDVIKLYGSSFTNIKSVRIGNTKCVGPVALTEFVIKCVLPGGFGPQVVSVTTAAGSSNKRTIEITKPPVPKTAPPPKTTTGKKQTSSPGKPTKTPTIPERKPDGTIGYFQSVKFTRTYLMKGGRMWEPGSLTSITMGPDGRYYMGSMEGVVYVVTTTLGNEVTSECRSPNVGPNRSILGVAFNPALGNKIVLYATTCVMTWNSKGYLPFAKGWHNGEVIAMQKTSSNSCLEKTKTVITGLPVSNYDHGVNHLGFDQSGNLLVTVGSSTNLGVSKPGDPLGGLPDSPLSGSMVIAPIMKKGFNGNIKYNQYSNPQTANKISGDVSVYAAGLRNSYGFCVHSNGNIYATDNGGNVEFGSRSMDCNREGSPRSEPDSLIQVKKGKWYGYANRNRGRFDSKQCVHRSPDDNVGGFEKPLTTLEPSTNGLMEYTANTFGAQMRGELFATKFAVYENGGAYRIQLDSSGGVKSVFVTEQHSGLAVAQSPTGGLYMPRVYQGEVAVLLPVEKNPGIMVVTSVYPFRGPKKGGNTITITGWNLTPPLTVTVGGKPCKNVGNFKGGRTLTCTVPSGSGKATVIARKGSKASRSYGFEYLYMAI